MSVYTCVYIHFEYSKLTLTIGKLAQEKKLLDFLIIYSTDITYTDLKISKKKKNTMYATYVTYIQEIYFQEKKNHSAYECVNETIQKS